jgi:hypothetical protein
MATAAQSRHSCSRAEQRHEPSVQREVTGLVVQGADLAGELESFRGRIEPGLDTTGAHLASGQ